MKNWKTTLSGFMTALGVALSQSSDETLKAVGVIITGLGGLLTGIFAKDFNITGGTVEQ